MINQVQAIIGGVKFGVRTCPITKIKINNKVVLAVSHAIQNKDLHQFINQGGGDVVFEGDVNLVKNGAMFYLDKLKEKHEIGQILIVTLGNGYVLPGRYVIESISIDFQDMLDDGKAKQQHWKVQLIKYGAL